MAFFPKRFSLAVATAALLALPACRKPDATGPAAASAPIEVGEYASLTGKEAAFGQSSHQGTVLAIEELNAAGGVLGRKLDLVTEDDSSKQGEPATVVKKLISRDEAIAVLGESTSSRSLEAAPICQADKVPMISPAATNPAVTQVGDYIFRVCFIDPFQGAVMAKFARDTLKLHRVAVLTSVSSAYSVGLAKYFKAGFTAGGGEIPAEQEYSEGDKDFNAQLTAIKAAGADGLFVPGYYTEAALVCIQARNLGLPVPIFGGDGWEAPELIQIGGAAVEGCYFSTHFSPENDAPAVRDFVAKYRARFGGESPDGMAALGYDSAAVLVDALRRAGTTAGPALRDALAATRNFPGVSGVITIDADRNATKAAVIITIKDGRFKFVQSIAP